MQPFWKKDRIGIIKNSIHEGDPYEYRVWSLAQGGIPAGADPIYRFGANYGINNLNDLNHLLKRNSSFRILIRATGVNENGDVVGYGKLHNGDTRPFLIEQLGQGPSSGLFGHPRTPAKLR